MCHSKSLVETGERKEMPVKGWEPNPMKYVALPAHARVLRVHIEERMAQLREYSEHCKWNYTEMNPSKVGVIASGPSYFYAKEVYNFSESQ